MLQFTQLLQGRGTDLGCPDSFTWVPGLHSNRHLDEQVSTEPSLGAAGHQVGLSPGLWMNPGWDVLRLLSACHALRHPAYSALFWFARAAGPSLNHRVGIGPHGVRGGRWAWACRAFPLPYFSFIESCASRRVQAPSPETLLPPVLPGNTEARPHPLR